MWCQVYRSWGNGDPWHASAPVQRDLDQSRWSAQLWRTDGSGIVGPDTVVLTVGALWDVPGRPRMAFLAAAHARKLELAPLRHAIRASA
ncbi:MAG: hypothetical protein ACRDR6_25595 [Pseudonocardiaceae bacterium]